MNKIGGVNSNAPLHLNQLESSSSEGDVSYIQFNSIGRYASGTGLMFVHDGLVKRSRASDKPFVRLKVSDCNGDTCTAFAFNVGDAVECGEQLNRIKGHIIQAYWEENFLDTMGLTLRISKIFRVEETPQMLSLFVGSMHGVMDALSEFKQSLSSKVGMSVAMPAGLADTSYPDICDGKVGGLVYFYQSVFESLVALDPLLRPEERATLYKTFTLYIFAHSAYMQAKDGGTDNILFLSALNNRVATLSSKLELSKSAAEIATSFFGYSPKDVFIRTILRCADSVYTAHKEFSIWRTLPAMQPVHTKDGELMRYE